MAGVSKQRRLMFRVLPSADGTATWKLKDFKGGVKRFQFKKDAVETGRKICRTLHSEGALLQLVVSRKDGTIEYENTYGADPRRFKG